MARTNNKEKPIKAKKFNNLKKTKGPPRKKKMDDANSVKENTKNEVTNNESVLELLTKCPELNQTFEYILYSNKYKHTLTDVFNIIKMLMSKLEELQNHDVDLKNIFETINFNYKIKGLVQSTAINLSHVVEQLNVNESKFLSFAHNFGPSKVTTDGSENITNNGMSDFISKPAASEESVVSSSPKCNYDNRSVSREEPIVSISPICDYNYPGVSREEPVVSSSPAFNNNSPSGSRKIKTENIIVPINPNIFGSNRTIVLSDDEYEESNSHYVSGKQSSTPSKSKVNNQDLESYVIGSDIKDILSDQDNSNDVIPNSRQNLDNTVQNLSSRLITPIKKVKQVRQKNNETLSVEIINEARKSDFRLRKRLNNRNNETLELVKKLNLQPYEIVLEFDLVKKKPLVVVQKELAKVLKKHQVEGIRFLWDTVFETVDLTNTTKGTGCILAHRMGIGKTLQVIALMYTILCHSQINVKTFLIICPPGLIYNWMDEIYKWLKDVDKNEVVKVYDLPKTNKLYNITNIATWKSKGGILILSYENFKSLVNCKQIDLRESFAHTLIDPGPDVVILDEGHYIKNTNTLLLKSLTQIKTKRRIVLTGTPMQNSLKEYYTMVDFVKPNILGNFGDFTATFIKPIDAGQFVDSCDEAVTIMKHRTFILHKLLQNTVHRIDDRNLTPLFTEKIEYTVEVNMTEFQCELYERFLAHNKTSNDSCGVFLRLHVLTLITLHPLTLYILVHNKSNKQPEFGTTAFDNKFIKDLSWILEYKEDPRFFETNQSNKMMYLLSMIKECEKKKDKILCFLKSPLALDALEFFLKQEKKWTTGEDYFRMDGKTPLSIRNQMCEAFNNAENAAKLFILSMGTGVLGYNMVGANRVMLLNTSWNPSNDLQAIYRCLRFGQKKTVYVNRLLARGTVEPKAYYRQISKLGMASSVVDMQHMSRKVSYDQTNDLFTFDSSKYYYTLGPNTKDPALNQLIRHQCASISDLKEHDSMLVESVDEQLTVDERKFLWLSFKNKELGNKKLVVPKPLSKLKNIEQPKEKSNTNVNHKEIKQEKNDNFFVSRNSSFQTEEQQTSTSRKSYSPRNFSKPRPLPKFSGIHTSFTNEGDKVVDNSTNSNSQLNNNFVDKCNTWHRIEPIQNQFKQFQNKSFINHKRYQNRSQPYLGRSSSYQNQHNQYGNQAWHPDQRTPTNNNIQNRSGMLR